MLRDRDSTSGRPYRRAQRAERLAGPSRTPPGCYPPTAAHLVTFRDVTAVPLAPEPVVGLLKSSNAGRRALINRLGAEAAIVNHPSRWTRDYASLEAIRTGVLVVRGRFPPVATTPCGYPGGPTCGPRRGAGLLCVDDARHPKHGAWILRRLGDSADGVPGDDSRQRGAPAGRTEAVAPPAAPA